ncbi:RNA polymerase sigma-70 factor [Actinoallomurus vinaceus]|uniref:RNA polymerase sigma-70 factor n=1 Tax=Actinoallomurus vinaceus TaxID=1080074 RepID=A0ABP8UEP5_9ACTN
MSDPLDTATTEFARHREMLFAIVYNLLGTVADTEDVLQETWLSWTSARGEHINDVRAYLARIAVNAALSRLRRARHEAYVGPWLPEPVVTDAADDVVRADTVSLGLLVVLETLSPLERAVFVLRESFGYEHAEIAEMLGRSPAAVRQLAHRAREHVHARRPRFSPAPAVRRKVTERFLAAAAGGDLTALMEVLAPDVTLWTDGGGTRRAAHRPILGRDKVGRLLASVAPDFPAELDIRHLDLNGEPGVAIVDGDRLFAVVVIELSPEDGRIRAIYGLVNPAKLTGVADALGLVTDAPAAP